jgi:ribosomal protein S18 acetylase RimI-like enzyme
MTKPTIKAVTPSSVDQAVGTVVLAFGADPAARWLYPDYHQYTVNFPSFVRAFGGKAFEQGSAYSIGGFSGVALWLPPGVHPDEETMAALIQRSVSEHKLEEVLGVFEQMGSYHPSEPHWYLPLIGVDPAQQGRGYGSALMKHALIRCDRDQKLAYLESSNPKNISLHERHGFELLGTIQVGASPAICPMLRKPRPRQLSKEKSHVS